MRQKYVKTSGLFIRLTRFSTKLNKNKKTEKGRYTGLKVSQNKFELIFRQIRNM
jgi:hypothetical protein